MRQTVDGHHMRSTITSSRWATWFAFLLVLGTLTGSLSAQQDVENLAPPGDEAPAVPLKFEEGLFGLSSNEGSSDSDEPKQHPGKDKEPIISVTWSPLSGEPNIAVLAIRVELQDHANTYDFIPVKGSKPISAILAASSGGPSLSGSMNLKSGDRSSGLKKRRNSLTKKKRNV